MENRNYIIIKTSIIGIITNILLSIFKVIVGLLSSSIAIVLDAVNNISDAASSIITIIGTKLAGKAPDKKHPFGYGRIEYISALLISFIVLYAGVTSLQESVKNIINPSTPSYNTATLIIVFVGVIVKIILGTYVKNIGVKVNSSSLVNSGEDAKLDSIISASTLIAAIIYLFTKISLEAYLGLIISIVIIKSALEMLKDTISSILGERVDIDMVNEIKKTVVSYKDVNGVYDIVLIDFGPDSYRGSLHIEVPDTYTANELDELLRDIQTNVYHKHNVLLNAIGVYSINTKDEEAIKIRENVRNIVMGHNNVKQMHGFYVNNEKMTLRFDVIISFDEKDRVSLYKHIVNDIQKEYPNYKLNIALDTDFSES